MVEISYISGILKAINEAWTLGSKAWTLRSKKTPEKIHDVASFLALVDPEKRKAVRQLETTKYCYEWTIFVEEVVFDPPRKRRETNSMIFRFSKDGVESMMDRQMGFFGRQLRAKAEMLRSGDQIKIRGYFQLLSIFGEIYITDIERL